MRIPGRGYSRRMDSLYAFGIDAGVDTLTSWMRAVSLCAPRIRGGQALLIGETDPTLAQSLMLWNSTLLAQTELREREQTALPPVFAAACVWGRRDAVKVTLERIGALGGGDLSAIETTEGMLPSVLGPVPIPQPRTIDSRELEGTADRVKAVVRVPQSREVSWRCVCVPPVPAMWPRVNRENCVFSLIRRSESDARPLAVKN